jgi:hypothetical protein
VKKRKPVSTEKISRRLTRMTQIKWGVISTLFNSLSVLIRVIGVHLRLIPCREE